MSEVPADSSAAPDDAYDERRLRSLDLLRGIAVAGMVVVNGEGNPREKLPGVAHAAWDGLTAADLVFPTFLFVGGAALGIALRRSPGVHASLLRRSATLFALGLALVAVPWPGLDSVRVMGVLQRIGVCTLLAALVLLHVRRWRWQVAMGAAVLAAYSAVLLAAGAAGRAPETNLPHRIDAWLLGNDHLYSTVRGDPEGLASTPAAVVTVLLGAWTVRLVRARGQRVAALAGAGVLAAGALLLLVLPSNKFLWSPTFVLLSGGIAMLALTALSTAADASVRRVVGRPWEMLGRNALVAYIGSEVTIAVLRVLPSPGDGPARDWVYRLLAPLAGPQGGSLLYAVLVLALWWAVCAVLWRRRTFVTV